MLPVPATVIAEAIRVLSKQLTAENVVFENVHDPHNTSACMRTLDAFGAQNVHVVSSYNTFELNQEVDKGAHKWLTVHHHAGIAQCIDALRARRLFVSASDLSPGAIALADTGWNTRLRMPVSTGSAPASTATPGPDALVESPYSGLAIVFGNESRGVSALGRLMSHERFWIPMLGFAQSLNISVSVAVTLQHCRSSGLLRPDLSEAERQRLVLHWLLVSVPYAAHLLRRHKIDIPDFT